MKLERVRHKRRMQRTYKKEEKPLNGTRSAYERRKQFVILKIPQGVGSPLWTATFQHSTILEMRLYPGLIPIEFSQVIQM
jgi:hypothetical protein